MSQMEPLGCSHRSPDDDFFCEKYKVWYPMQDCNYRVLHRTFEGCNDCFQGRVNLRPRRAPAQAAPAASLNVLFFPPTPEATAVPATTGVPRKR